MKWRKFLSNSEMIKKSKVYFLWNKIKSKISVLANYFCRMLFETPMHLVHTKFMDKKTINAEQNNIVHRFRSIKCN